MELEKLVSDLVFLICGLRNWAVWLQGSSSSDVSQDARILEEGVLKRQFWCGRKGKGKELVA